MLLLETENALFVKANIAVACFLSCICNICVVANKTVTSMKAKN